MKIIFSDLDGTLLHLRTYTSEAAQPALGALKNRGIPLVFCTSKTLAEVEFWRDRLNNREPFVIENGGAIYIPKGYFGSPVEGAVERGGYEVVELGTPYAEVLDVLRSTSKETGCEVLGFNDMTVAELSLRTRLPIRQAEMAKMRQYDEPFEIIGTSGRNLLAMIERRGKRWTRGDRFHHITGADKAQAVSRLLDLYRLAFGKVATVGIGDGHNDVEFLNVVDVPIIVRTQFAEPLRASVPRGRITDSPGPQGWNEAVMALVA